MSTELERAYNRGYRAALAERRDMDKALARVVKAAKAYVATLRPDGGLDIGGIYAAVAELERLEAEAQL